MKITIIGPGAIGLILASSLEDKNEVSLLVRRENYDKLSHKGLWVIQNGSKKSVNARLTTEVSNCDVVIIAVKGYDLDGTKKDFLLLL